MKIAVALSGGVDSAVAALLLKEAGHDVCGVMMRLLDETGGEADAAAVAEKLGIPFRVFDLRAEFEKEVILPFVREYESGRTPNPCVLCNRALKFGALLRLAECDKLATGHYARVTEENGVFSLCKAKDKTKDQSYVLAGLANETLARVLFPLGEYTKDGVRALAEAHGFGVAHKKDSQDICFIPDGDHAAFLMRYTKKAYPCGDFLSSDGRVLGTHKGLIRYTVGQRKGLGLSLPSPLFVQRLDVARNAVILGDDASLYQTVLPLSNVRFTAHPSHFPADGVCRAKVRYRQEETDAVFSLTEGDNGRLVFSSPVRAPAKGQTAVLYVGDEVFAAATIEERKEEPV